MPFSIDKIRLTHVRIPLVEPFRISNGEVAEKDGIVAEVHSDGLVGYGESSPMAGSFYSSDTPESCWRDLTGTLAAAILQRTFDTLDDACDWLDARPESNFAKVAIETALWDLEAQRAGVPLHQFLARSACETARDHAESGLAVGLYDHLDGLLGAIDKWLTRDAYRRVKIKIQRGRDADLIAAARARFGAIPLMTDANADYSIEHLPVFQKLDEYSLMMYEQPLGGRMLAESAELQRAVRTPVCLDESLESVADLEKAIELRSFRIANIKIQRVGGFRNALRVYRLCRANGIGIWVGTMPELGIGQAQGAALSTLPGCGYPTDVEASTRWFRDDIIDPFVEVRDGLIPMPVTPGFGYRIVPEKFERYGVARWETAS